MAINGLSTDTNAGISPVNYKTSAPENTAPKQTFTETDAVVYEKSAENETTAAAERKVDQDTIDRLKAEADERNAQLKGLVEKMLLKQSGTLLNSEGLASVYRRLEVDEETRKQAQADIAEDGYWGVEQTSDRMVSFAKALAGDDVEMAEKMIDAVKEGYRQAEEAWGEELPELCRNTLDATISKLKEWIAGLKGTDTETGTEAPKSEENAADVASTDIAK